MLILQDWASSDYLNGPLKPLVRDLGYDPTLPTNKSLADLVVRHLGIIQEQAYTTNAFPFIKPGPMDAPIKPRHFFTAVVGEFLIEEIGIVSPRVAICLGRDTFNAVRSALGLVKIEPLTVAIENGFRFSDTNRQMN